MVTWVYLIGEHYTAKRQCSLSCMWTVKLPLTTIYWKSFTGCGYFLWSVFPLLLGASIGNVSQNFFDTFSGGLWPQPLPLISELSGIFDQQTLLLTENLLQFLKWCPYKGRGVYPQLWQPVPTKTFLQAAKAAAMSTIPCAETRPPIPPFLLVQNLSSKWVA